jgi:DNA-binding response OmpR family regulator
MTHPAQIRDAADPTPRAPQGSATRLMLLEDDPKLRGAFARRLRSDGHTVDEVAHLHGARRAVASNRYDCLVLDRMVPDGDGLDLVEELQHRSGRAPMIVLSALAEDAQRVDGLWAGADDYVAKPVCLDELSLRVRNMTQERRVEAPSPILRVGGVELDRSRQQVWADEHEVHLTRRQYGVLEHLMLRCDQIVLTEELLEHCWDGRRPLFANPLATQVTRLRSIFRDHLRIRAVRGAGYLLQAANAEPT